MDCFGFCGEKCSKKKKKSKGKGKYKEETNGGVPIPLQEETQFPESKGDGQEMGTRPETLLQASPETGDLSPQPSDLNVMQDEMLNRNGLNYVKQTDRVMQDFKKKNRRKPKQRHYHENQETSDSDNDSSSDSTSDESSSSVNSYDSPEERTKSIKTKKKSKSIVINAQGGIFDFGKHNTNKVVHIQYGGQMKTGKTKKRSKKHTKDIKLQMDQEQSQQDLPGSFHKICDETDTIANMEKIVEAAKSVGIIRSPRGQGTGFRVGDSYIMTALHVVECIINPVIQPLSHEEGKTNVKLLGDRKVHIDFDYKSSTNASKEGTADKTIRFNFEPEIFYQNKELDTAVLKLKPSNFEFPGPLTRFCHCAKTLPMYFIGHSNNQVKTFDKTKTKDMTDLMIKECEEWSEKHLIGHQEKFRGFGGAMDPRRILFDCSSTFNKGASGAPGFIISCHDNMPYAVSILLRGYPDWYYNEEVKEKVCLPRQYTFEQGVRITEVYKDMSAKNPSLCSEIFGSGT